ncbi:MAG TPA: alpha/beta-hydrolase N-terminal domain-containing protein, partial [Arachnia sp.]|nr:alpha/beta-hydrolase N-terminal domain-containing protein [Arachnia sp.]
MKNYLQQYLRSLNPVGVAVGAVLLALSLTPSLLPRPAVLKGVGSGIVFGIGYLLGVALALLGARLTRWRPPQEWLRWARLVGWPLYGAVLLAAMIGGVAAQNEVRRIVE